MGGGNKLLQKGMKKWIGRDENGKVRRYGDNMSSRWSHAKQWPVFKQLFFPKVEMPKSVQQGPTCLQCISSGSHGSEASNRLDAAAPHHFQSCSSKARPWVRDHPRWKKPHCPWSWLFPFAIALHGFLLKPLCILSPIFPGHLHLAYPAPDPLLRLTRIILLSLVAPRARPLWHVSAKKPGHCCSGKRNRDLLGSLQSQNLNSTD